MSFAVNALAVLGEAERAKAWAERAMLFDPNNMNMRYNFACAFASNLHEVDAALDLLGPVMEKTGIEHLNWTKADSDLDSIRDHPRYQAMIATAAARLAQAKEIPASPEPT
jgi:adenylate cyclase